MNRNTKWVIAALAVSVAANIFMIGLSLGKNVVGGKNIRPPSHAAGLNARALGQYLDTDERTAMRSIIDAERRQIRRNLRQLHDNEEAIRDALRAPTVNQQELDALIDKHETLVTGSRAGVQRKLFNYMATLPLEKRKQIASDLFKPRERRGRGGERFRRPPREGGEYGPPPSPPHFDELDENRPVTP